MKVLKKKKNSLLPHLEIEGMKKQEKKGLIEKLKSALQSRPVLVVNYLPHFKEKILWHLAKFQKHASALFLRLVAFLVHEIHSGVFFLVVVENQWQERILHLHRPSPVGLPSLKVSAAP